ncbi:MAG TPA: DUF4139 domain-containing protein [Polyangia bacterium]|nr:DUF4139 domain-containing protein [Polyangia bacterium]
MTTGSALALAAALAALSPPPSINQAPPGRVPGVVWTAAGAASAPLVETRIAEVTVFGDRARVRRRGRAPSPSGGGISMVRFPSLPGAVLVDTIRVSAAGGRVLRVEATAAERERSTLAQAHRLLDQLDGVADRLLALDDRRATDEWEVGLLRGLAPAPLVPEEKREGRKIPAADAASWWRALDFVAERSRAASGRLLRLDVDRRNLTAERDRLLADYKAFERGGSAERVVDVAAIVDAGSARSGAELELEYFIAGASWTPAYDLHFTSARAEVRLETAAVVQQTTGEDWDDVALLLSTATPGHGIDLPERLAWTLGERSDFVPVLRQRQSEDANGYMDADGDAIPDDMDGCPDEPGSLDGCPDNDDETNTKAARSSEIEKQANDLRRQVVELRGARPSGAPQIRTAPAKSRIIGGLNPAASVMADSRPLRLMSIIDDGKKVPTVTVPMALLEAAPAHGKAQSDTYLPAASAGGLDYVYRAPTTATIASAAKQIRVPLASQPFRAAVFHEATPGLATTAFLRARVHNDGQRPLLRGPVTIFDDGELVGVGEIQTTGPGGDIELPLGADEDVRLERQVVPSTKTTGLIMKSDETTYDVQIQIGNYKKRKVTIEIVDQVPRSGRDKVEVKLLGVQPAALKPPDAEGVLRWRLELGPGATQTLKLSYRIARPKGWQLRQN